MGGKYALILAFSYNRVLGANYEIQQLHSSINDIELIVSLCESRNIPYENITIVMDLLPGKSLTSRIRKCNLRTNPYPSDVFVCREISQFIENTVRGIDDNSYKNDTFGPEVLVYFSCHGKRLGPKEQGIVLTSDDGRSLKYFLAKDIFRMIFGDFEINEDAICQIPVYSEIQVKRNTEKGSYIEKIFSEEKIDIKLSSTVASPENSPHVFLPTRSSYASNRGIPVSARMLIIVDTCYSEHMMYFPFTYNPSRREMVSTDNFNTNIGIDLPNCFAISSCEADKTTKFSSSSSSLTEILYRAFYKYDGVLNIALLYDAIYNSSNSKITKIIEKDNAHPIITSTVNDSSVCIPFFNTIIQKPVIIIEK